MSREDQLLLRKKRKAEEEAAKATRKTAAKSKVVKGVPGDTLEEEAEEVQKEAPQFGVSSEAPASDKEDGVVAAPPIKKKGWPKGKAKSPPRKPKRRAKQKLRQQQLERKRARSKLE